LTVSIPSNIILQPIGGLNNTRIANFNLFIVSGENKTNNKIIILFSLVETITQGLQTLSLFSLVESITQ
jgi:hypothetical protein